MSLTSCFILLADLIPKRTDTVSHAGYKFKVVDIDNYKIDRLPVMKLPEQ